MCNRQHKFSANQGLFGKLIEISIYIYSKANLRFAEKDLKVLHHEPVTRFCGKEVLMVS